jgi:hypothetical protein
MHRMGSRRWRMGLMNARMRISLKPLDCISGKIEYRTPNTEHRITNVEVGCRRWRVGPHDAELRISLNPWHSIALATECSSWMRTQAEVKPSLPSASHPIHPMNPS